MRGVLAAAVVCVLAVGCGRKPAESAATDVQPTAQRAKFEPTGPTAKVEPKSLPKLLTARSLYDETKDYPTRYTNKEIRVRVRVDAVRQSSGYVTFSQRIEPEFPFPDVAATVKAGDAPDVKRGDEVDVVGVISQQNHKLTIEVTGKVMPVAK